MIFVKTSAEKAWENYTRTTSARFYQFSHLFLILLVYELLSWFVLTSHASEYNGIDVWFWFFHAYFPLFGTIFSLFLLFYIGNYLYLDWFGIKDRWQLKKEDAEKKKKKNYRPPKKDPLARELNIYYWGLIVLEGLVYAILIFLVLKYLIFGFLKIFLPEIHIPFSVSDVDSLKGYLTNPVQDVAISFGGGFYKELIFRLLVFHLLIYFSDKIPLFKGAKTREHKLDERFKFKIPKFNAKDSGALWLIVVGTMIFVFSHHVLPNSDAFSVYGIFYRFFYGLLMYLIFVNRRFAVAAWTHIFYDLFIFFLV